MVVLSAMVDSLGNELVGKLSSNAFFAKGSVFRVEVTALMGASASSAPAATAFV